MDRRIFLKKNLAGVFAAGFLVNWGTMEQIRQYMQQDKPLLTENNLNRFFSRSVRSGKLEEYLKEAMEDTPAFLDKYFSMSPAQVKLVREFNTEDLQQLRELCSTALTEKKIPTFQFGPVRAEQCQKTKILLRAEKGLINVSI